jgi:hypothetical protein
MEFSPDKAPEESSEKTPEESPAEESPDEQPSKTGTRKDADSGVDGRNGNMFKADLHKLCNIWLAKKIAQNKGQCSPG